MTRSMAFAQFDGRTGPGFHTSFMPRLLLHNCVMTIYNLVHNTYVTVALAFDLPTYYDTNVNYISAAGTCIGCCLAP